MGDGQPNPAGCLCHRIEPQGHPQPAKEVDDHFMGFGQVARAMACSCQGTVYHLILDEAHYAKHGDTKRTRWIFGGGENPVADPLISCSDRVTALTGTPLPKRPLEAYVLARHLAPDSIDFMSEEEFGNRFNLVTSGMFQRPNGDVGFCKEEWAGNEAELQNRLRANFMVRHLKRDVMAELEYPVFDLIRVEETKAVKQASRRNACLILTQPRYPVETPKP